MSVQYTAPRDRVVDHQYRTLLSKILASGRKIFPIQGGFSQMIFGHEMRFSLSNGFPLITERDLSGRFLKAAIGEHVAFLNGARTQEELVSFGCPHWSRWVTEEKCADFGLLPGDLGDGSYGVAWANFPTAEGYTVNQMENVIELAKRVAREGRYLRTLRVSNWVPQHVVPGKNNPRKTVVAPCHGDLHLNIYPETREIDVIHCQRSADAPVGLVFNMAQYAAWGMMVAQVLSHATGEEYSFNELVYWLQDVHLYEEQIQAVERLLERGPRIFPTMILDEKVDCLFDFRPEHFTLSDYDPHPSMVIPTPV